MSEQLKVGFARIDISPEESVPLAGYGNTSQRMSEMVMDPLYANALALTGADGNTVVVIVMDLGNMYPPLPSMRQDVSAATGLPVEKIMFCCTHTHSAPHLNNSEKDSIPRYCEKLRRCLPEVAVAALADRAEATLSVSDIQTQNMNFVRRYVLADGTYAGDNYGHADISPIVAHETEGDHQLQIVKFSRAGSKDIIMTNFQGHPHRAPATNWLGCTSDLVYIYRQELETAVDCHALYFTGSSGNMNCHSRIQEENITPDYIAHGKALAQYALKALQNLRPVETGSVRNFCMHYEGQANHSEDYKVEQAKVVVERWENGSGYAGAIAGYEDLFNSPYHAISVIGKSKRPLTMDVELNGISFGDVSMVFAPFELFCELGAAIKEATPFETTFVCCYANSIISYMPTKLGFEHGGYGPNQCRLMPGTGEILVEKFVDILNQLKK